MTEPTRLSYFENADRLKATKAGDSPIVLVLGGSTFMGRETLDALLQMPARVCVVNRGRSYWGTKDPSNGQVARITADRREKSEFAEKIDAVTTRQNETWSLVADFSAYDGDDINAALQGLRGRFHLYAYISSDSVYEVSELAGAGWQSGVSDVLVSEMCSKRPANPDMRKRLRKADGYGDGKLEAEEALAAGIGMCSTHPRAIALRLPDVLGPYDDTLRLWAYWHWWHAGPDNRPQVKKPTLKRRDPSQEPGHLDPPLAFVFSRDVARFLVHLISSRLPDLSSDSTGTPTSFDAVNLGCDLQVPLRNFLELFARTAGIKDGSGPIEVERPKGFLPSVDRPLPLDFKKLKETYGFTTTPLEEVLKICSEWFAYACKSFPEEATEAAMKLPPNARAPALANAGLEMPTPRSSSSDSSSG